MTVAPCCTKICLTTPLRSASMLFSIFFASRTTNVCPAVTLSPTATLTASTVPGSGHLMAEPAEGAEGAIRGAGAAVVGVIMPLLASRGAGATWGLDEEAAEAPAISTS